VINTSVITSVNIDAGTVYLYTLGNSALKYFDDITRQACAGESIEPIKPPRKPIVI